MGGASSSPRSRSTAAILALYVLVGCCTLAIGADLRRILVARDLGAGRVAVDALLAADQLVRVSTVVFSVAYLVATLLTLRWAAAARRDPGVLQVPGVRPVVRAAVVLVALTVLAHVLAGTVLGAATDVGDRERIDALRAGAKLLGVMAAGAVILAVTRVATAQAARAAEAGTSSAPPRPRRDPATGSGLTVVSEEDARRGSSA